MNGGSWNFQSRAKFSLFSAEPQGQQSATAELLLPSLFMAGQHRSLSHNNQPATCFCRKKLRLKREQSWEVLHS